MLEMVTHVLGSYAPNTDSDLVLLAHERSDLFKSITEVVLLQLQGLSSLCFSRDVTARRYRGKSSAMSKARDSVSTCWALEVCFRQRQLSTDMLKA